jgi:hypothetical protein
MLGVSAVNAELSQSLGLTLQELVPILKRGGDTSCFQCLACEITLCFVRENVDNRLCGAR